MSTMSPAGNATPAGNAARHNIKVGAAADSPYLTDNNYAGLLGSEFSDLTAENEMKFATVAPTSVTTDYSGADSLVTFAQSHQMAVRGHTRVWYQQVPNWVTSGGYGSAQLSSILQNHITNEVTHFAGKVFAWDVVNEAAIVQAFSDVGIHRQVLVDSAVFPGLGWGLLWDANYQKKPAYTNVLNALQ